MTATHVIDASAVVPAFINTHLSSEAADLLQAMQHGPVQGIAPDLIFAEVANALWKWARATKASAQDVDASLQDFTSLGVQTVQLSTVVNSAARIAMAFQISAYDGCYVALAQHARLPLITGDQKLLAKMHGSQHQLIHLADFVRTL